MRFLYAVEIVKPKAQLIKITALRLVCFWYSIFAAASVPGILEASSNQNLRYGKSNQRSKSHFCIGISCRAFICLFAFTSNDKIDA